MAIAWIFLSSTGILFASMNADSLYILKQIYKKTFFRLGYYKYLLPEKMICNVQFWFVMHRSLMSSVPLLSIIGLFLILYAKDWTWVSSSVKINFAHSLTGIITIGISVIQVSIYKKNKIKLSV